MRLQYRLENRTYSNSSAAATAWCSGEAMEGSCTQPEPPASTVTFTVTGFPLIRESSDRRRGILQPDCLPLNPEDGVGRLGAEKLKDAKKKKW